MDSYSDVDFASARRVDVSMLPSVFADAVEACQRHTQAPIELIFASALGAASLACQERFDVVRPTGNTSPLSLFLLTIAESGERKTTADNFFQTSIRAVEVDRRQARQFAAISPQGVPYESALKAWKIRQAELEHIYRMALREGANGEELANIEKSLGTDRPVAPRDARMIFMNSTLEAILEALAGSRRSVGLISDEGGVVLDSRVSQHLSSLNVLWEGSPIHVDRVSKPSFHISDARVTISIMSQPGMFRRFIWRRNSEARDLGFLARALTCFPASTQGMRQITPLERPFSALDGEFHSIVKMIMSKGEREATMRKLAFDQFAAQLWIKFAQSVERNLARDGYFAEVRDFGSKLADNVARLAGIFAVFSSRGAVPAHIDLPSVKSAIHVGMWYAQEFVRLFGNAQQISEDHELCKLLVEFLSVKEQMQQLYDGWLRAAEVLQYGPPKLRKARLLDSAIAYGAAHGTVEVKYSGRTRFVRRRSDS